MSMSEGALTERELYDHFGESTIRDRVVYLYGKMEIFLELRGLNARMFISAAKLRQAVLDYFVDIYRLKAFHGINAVNRYKIVAYESFWLLRRQPLQIREENPDIDIDACTFANEEFVSSLIALAFTTPADDTDSMYRSIILPGREQSRAFEDLKERMLYHLKYRTVDARNLELLLNAYEVAYLMGASHPDRVAVF